MKRSYNLILNSTLGEEQMTSLTTDTHTVLFNFIQWDRFLPENKKFKLTWTYTAAANMLQARDVAYIQLEGLILDSNKQVSSTSDGSPSTINLGILKNKGYNLYGTNTNLNIGYLDANLEDNQPVILNSRPHNGPLKINIRTQDNRAWLDDTGAQINAGTIQKSAPPADYAFLRLVPNRVRWFIGSIIWYQTGLYSRYTKIIDFRGDYRGDGNNTTNQLFNVAQYGFATGGINTEIETATSEKLGGGGQNPAHYILTLNFEEI